MEWKHEKLSPSLIALAHPVGRMKLAEAFVAGAIRGPALTRGFLSHIPMDQL